MPETGNGFISLTPREVEIARNNHELAVFREKYEPHLLKLCQEALELPADCFAIDRSTRWILASWYIGKEYGSTDRMSVRLLLERRNPEQSNYHVGWVGSISLQAPYDHKHFEFASLTTQRFLPDAIRELLAAFHERMAADVPKTQDPRPKTQ